MYNTSKLSEDSLEFFQNLPSIARGDKELISFGIARALSNQLSIPSTQVANSSDYYLQTNYSNVRHLVSLINELCAIDLNRVQELVKIFWTVRYNIVYPRRKIYIGNNNTPESFFFGYGTLICQKDAEVISKNAQQLVFIFNGITQALIEVIEVADITEVVTVGR